MSETTPPEDLLEFLGSIDEDNDETEGGDFSDFLAQAEVDPVASDERPRKPPPEEEKHE